MSQLVVSAPAKINLSLDVVGRRADGYHLLSTVMQSLELADRVTVALDPDNAGIRLTCSTAGIPLDHRNTAWRAAHSFMAAIGLEAAVTIGLLKRIPVSAGLAGGSADAAAVLYALNHLLPGRLTRSQLFDLAGSIGADVPFCLQGATVLCEGIGEKLTPLPSLDQLPVLLCKPDFGLSTPWVFSRLDRGSLGPRPDQPAILAALQAHDLTGLGLHTANVLESVSLTAYPVLQDLKRLLKNAGASVALMSGSGPTVFGLFLDGAACEAARQLVVRQAPQSTLILATRTTDHGPQILDDQQ